jgi:hypothetical protein
MTFTMQLSLKFQPVACHTRYVVPVAKGLTGLITGDTVPIVAFKSICFPCRMDNVSEHMYAS